MILPLQTPCTVLANPARQRHSYSPRSNPSIHSSIKPRHGLGLLLHDLTAIEKTKVDFTPEVICSN